MYNYCKTIAHTVLKVGYCMEYGKLSLFQRIFYRKNVECTYLINNFISIYYKIFNFVIQSVVQEPRALSTEAC